MTSISKETVNELVKFSDKYLSENAIDAGHDFSHHKRVYETALNIVAKESLDIDKDILKIACYLHDLVGVDFKDLLREHDINNIVINQIVYSIENHSFNKRPKLIIGKVLFDADKLDAVNINRLRAVANAIKRRQLSQNRKLIYLKVGTLWLNLMRYRLHFDTSKNMFEERLNNIINSDEFINTSKEIQIDPKVIIKQVKTRDRIDKKLLFPFISKIIDLRSLILRK